MERYKKYIGIIIFILAVVGLICLVIGLIVPKYNEWNNLQAQVAQVSQTLEGKKRAKDNIARKIRKLKESVMTSQKKIYSPIEDNLGNDTLFFTLYNDVIEMVHSNSIKIKSIDYQYNPNGDLFVAQGDQYFVCDVNMEIVSNYVSLGKLIQDLYQYPYYIRINSIDVIAYPKDKKILLTKISLRLYAHTTPVEQSLMSEQTVDGATTPLPQE